MNAKKIISILLCLCMMTGLLVVAAHAANPTIDLNNASNRTNFSVTQQIWKQNGITVTNDKAGSSANVGDYTKPARFYKGTSLTIAYTQNIAKIIFTCDDYKETYPNDLATSITGADVSVDGLIVTVTPNAAANSFTIAALAGQVRVDSIEVVPGETIGGGDIGGGTEPSPEPTPEIDPEVKAILDAAYALEEGAQMDEDVSLTGKVTKIDTPYSEQFNNISVTIEIPGAADQPILCYRMGGEDIKKIAVGDTITVTGRIKNHYGTIEFAQGCSMDDRIPGENEAPVVPEDPKEIVDAAFALDKGASLPYEATLTGTVTEIVTEYSEDYKNITVTIEVEGTDGKKTIECYRMKGEGAADLKVGDIISVTGQLTRFYREATEDKAELDKIEFNSGCTFVPYVAEEGGDDTTDDDTTGDDTTGDDTTGDDTTGDDTTGNDTTGDNTTGGNEPPKTSDITMIAVMIVAVLSATTVAVMVIGKKKLI